MLVSYLSARFDALHEAQENNDPREKKSEWQVVLESAEVARLAKAVGDVQDVLLPKLTQIEEDFLHTLISQYKDIQRHANDKEPVGTMFGCWCSCASPALC